MTIQQLVEIRQLALLDQVFFFSSQLLSIVNKLFFFKKGGAPNAPTGENTLVNLTVECSDTKLGEEVISFTHTHHTIITHSFFFFK
jgi:hypothetical protein